jgi:superfamily II DNA or RNA helicase
MPGKKRKKRKKKKTSARKKSNKPKVTQKDLALFEFHRHAVALLPEPEDENPGVAIMVAHKDPMQSSITCNCSGTGTPTCSHVKKLAAVYHFSQSLLGGKTLEQDFRETVWYELGAHMADGSREKPQTVSSKLVSEEGRQVLKINDSKGEELLTYFSSGPDRLRCADRCIDRPKKKNYPSRAQVLAKLALWTLTDTEREMAARGFKTRGQAFQEKFWYKWAYHSYRELGTRDFILDSDVELTHGTFHLTVKNLEGASVMRFPVPHSKVKSLLGRLDKYDLQYQGLTIYPKKLTTLYKIARTRDLALEITPFVQLTLQNGETKLFNEAALQKFHFGDLIYLPDQKILAELKKPQQVPPGLIQPGRNIIEREDIPAFLAAFGEDLSQGPFLPDASLKSLKISRKPDRIDITPQVLERDWCWLAVAYGFGNERLSLAEILEAKAEGRRYIEIQGGWMDTQSRELEGLDVLLNSLHDVRHETKAEQIKISRLDLLRLQAAADQDFKVSGSKPLVGRLRRLLDFKPSTSLPKIKGMASKLRAYQKLGAEWICFLYENGFGGLLCDDMGLGKTHEVMAFMLYLRRHRKIKKPFLVVCPTTVLSHWNDKIREHAPGLKAVLYYGGLRDINQTLETGDVLLTSYGILRRDIKILKKRAFGLAVFDEIQHIKNRFTQAHDAATGIRARMKLGLTGTPIENTLAELKTLMDLVIPGYLGRDDNFIIRYVNPIEQNLKSPRRRELSRLISPFTLRRLKSTVLSELPAKIEDIRTCRLSDDQVKLYRDAVSSRGRQLIQLLRGPQKSVPYMHIFALITLLKQICNHPATVEGNPENYDQFQSGKWELFKELLDESLDSGQKVVVYSQYLDMIRIVEKHLKQNKVNFATLTGASRHRGKIVSRFNKDPACRVFVGSLKAGGTGIDLVAASVVIHYDRWWNAAREDQATDRVHRIGQKRGVQVFKLVTEGTLEEKISAIIEKKKNLMDGVVKEDDPGLLKTFSRKQLIELLAAPNSIDD